MNAVYTSAAGAALLARRYQEELDAWPVPSEQRTVPTSQGETFVLSCGPADAPPVLLLHGSSANALRWQADAARWSGEFRLHAVDLIGEPGLSAPSRPALNSPAYVRWLDDVQDQLGLPSAAVVAESLGGWMAVSYACARPERVSRLALLAPGGLGKQKWSTVLAAVLLGSFGARAKRKSFGLLCGTEDLPEHAFLIQRHFRPRMETLPRFDHRALRRLSMPVLAVVGTRDRMFDSGGTRRALAAAVPHAAVTQVAGAGHFLPPQTTTVLDFLRAGEN